MISANVVEELLGAGWIRDDIQDDLIDGSPVQKELWRKGKTVEIRQVGKTIKVLSGENDCLQSIFTKFEDLEGLHVVIRESSRLRIYTENGEEFLVTLPIPLRKMWRSTFGVILESDLSKNDHFLDDPSIPTPKLLVLHHPLDDFTRIVSKNTRKGQLVEWQSNRYQILMISQEPSLAVTYDSESVG